MAEIINIKKYLREIETIKNLIDHFHENLTNNLFDERPNESQQKRYKRGETLFDQFDENLINITYILEKENIISEFFKDCKENKEKINAYRNSLINELVQMKKKTLSREEYLKIRYDWNSRRKESPDEKNRRECEELMEDIQYEKKEIVGLVEELKTLKVDLKNGGLSVNLKFEEFKKELQRDFILKEREEESKINAEQYHLKVDQVKQLETWTNLKCGDIIFDSTKHGWSKENNEFSKKIFNKSKVCIVIENEDGNIFGCYIDSTIDKVNEDIKDEHAFVFNLESNGRHPTPLKFDIKKEKCDKAFELRSDNWNGKLFRCGNGDISIFKEKLKSESYCEQSKYSDFDYQGVEKALVQNPNEYFTPKRFIVIQMK